MGTIHYEAVFSSGEFKSSGDLNELTHDGGYLFLVRKEEGYHCYNYSHYSAQVIDESDHPSQADINGFRFNSFRIAGEASNYCLVLQYYTPEGHYGSREFRADISYNYPRSGFSRIKTEWSIDSQYKDIFDFFDNVSKYGQDVYMQILELERGAYANDADYRYEKYIFEEYKQRILKVNECIQELIVPDGWRGIYNQDFRGIFYKSLQSIFIPESIKWIESLPLCFCDEIKKIFCYAPNPPQVDRHFKSYSPDTVLFVPKESLVNYVNDSVWSEVFPVIKVF